MKENNKLTNKKRLFSKQSYAKILSVFALTMVAVGSLAPVVVSAASITEYTAVPLVSNDGEKMTYEVVMATDGDDSFIGGEGYDYEDGGQNKWNQASLPIGCDVEGGVLNNCYGGLSNNAVKGEIIYANSWNGTQSTESIDVRVGAAPEELAAATEKTTYLVEEFNRMIEYVSGGGVTTDDPNAFVQGGMDLATKAYKAAIENTDQAQISSSQELGFTSDPADNVYFKMTAATPEQASAAKKGLPQTLFNTDNPNEYKKQFVTIYICEDAACTKTSASDTFLWLIPKGYYTGGDLNASLSSTILASNPNANCPNGDCTPAMAEMGVYDWYSINSIATNAAYAYVTPTVAATDANEASNVVNEDYDQGIIETMLDFTGGLKYQFEAWVKGVPEPHEFMNPWGEFSTWFFGIVPPSLTSLFIISLGISFIFAIALFGYSVLIRLLQVKTMSNDNSNIYAESSEILKGAGMFAFGTFLMYGILIACLFFSDTMYEIFWQAFGGTSAAASDALVIKPANMVQGIMQSTPMAVAYAATVGLWYIMILHQKVQIMIYAILIPITSIEFASAKGWDIVFQRLPQLLFLTVGKSMAFLFSYAILVILQGTAVEMQPVVAGFVFTLIVGIPQMILRSLGVKDTLFPQETASVMATTKMTDAARSGLNPVTNRGGGSGGSGGSGGGVNSNSFASPDAQANMGEIMKKTTLDKEGSTGVSAITDAQTGKAIGAEESKVSGFGGRAAAIVGGAATMANTAIGVAGAVDHAVKSTAAFATSPNDGFNAFKNMKNSYSNVGETASGAFTGGKDGEKAQFSAGMAMMAAGLASNRNDIDEDNDAPNTKESLGYKGDRVLHEGTFDKDKGGYGTSSYLASEIGSIQYAADEKDFATNGGVYHSSTVGENGSDTLSEHVAITEATPAIQKHMDHGLSAQESYEYHTKSTAAGATDEDRKAALATAISQGYTGHLEKNGNSGMKYETLKNGQVALKYSNTEKGSEFAKKDTLVKNGITNNNNAHVKRHSGQNGISTQEFASTRDLKYKASPNGGGTGK